MRLSFPYGACPGRLLTDRHFCAPIGEGDTIGLKRTGVHAGGFDAGR